MINFFEILHPPLLLVLFKKTDYNAKITEIESKIPSIIGLARNAALALVGNKISNINSLVKKADYGV